MTYRQALSNLSSNPALKLERNSTLAWTAILTLIMFSALCVLAGAGALLRLVFPLGSLAVGVFLYLRYPILYIGFTWWLWFLTPFLRRVIDYRSGWDAKGVILVSPYLVTLISFITLLRYLPRSYREGALPFVLSLAGVFYGFLVGLIMHPPVTVARTMLDWLSPVVFGFHLFINWRDYPKYSQNLQRTFLWAVLVTGLYGIYQYMVAPEWDKFWLIESGMNSSAGSAEAFGIRVWSTMHSPGPYANFMIAGLLLLFSSKDFLRIPAAMAGYLSFLLSLVRSGWGGWALGIVTLLSSVKPRLQMRLIVTVLVMALCVLPLTMIEPFSGVINERVQSITNLNDDVSYNERSENYNRQLNVALSNSLGNGIGTTFILNEKGVLETVVFDSGILDTFFTLGWFGAIPYLGGIILLMFTIFKGTEASFDPFVSASRAIAVALLMQLGFSSSMLGVSGVVLWTFLAMSMGANKYYRHQRIAVLKK